MQLIFIGESVKVIDAKDCTYLPQYPDIPWTAIMGLRDIIAHEYHRVDEEEIYAVIVNDLPALLEQVRSMKLDLQAIKQRLSRLLQLIRELISRSSGLFKMMLL